MKFFLEMGPGFVKACKNLTVNTEEDITIKPIVYVTVMEAS